jgi:hypothetical protein
VITGTRECGAAMCDKCIEIDAKIEHYNYLSAWITDQPTLDAVKKLTEELRAEKATLHPARPE